jgi:hypothetical protein
MRVADVMSNRPVTITPDVPVSEAFRVATAFGVQHLVVTEGRFPIGVVCVRCDLADAFPRRPFSNYMTRPITIGAYETAERASVFFCAACGTHMHVHPVPGCEWVAFCVDCWDRAGPPGLGDDLGDSA